MSAVMLQPKMASEMSKDIPKIGSVLAVEVEQALPNLLTVSLKAGSKVFRGVLIDTNGGACPMGMGDPLTVGKKLNEEFGVPVMDTAVILPDRELGAGDTAAVMENSALSFRQSYFQNMPLPPPRPLLFGKKGKHTEIKSKPLSNTRSRQFKLRPRQLLCTKCKEVCHGPKAKTARGGSRPDKNGLKRKLNASNEGVVRKKQKQVSRTLPNGDSHVAKSTASRQPTTPKASNKTGKKTSPAIKISYATPGKGQRLIVRIPPRSNSFNKHSDPPSLVTKEKKRVLSVPLSPLTPIGRHNLDSLKRPLVNGLHKSPIKTQHDKIRIVKTKGTYSIPSEKVPVRLYTPLPNSPSKLLNGNGKMTASVTVKPISLVNGCRSLNMSEKEKFLSLKLLPRVDNSDAASDCSSHTTSSRSSGKGGRKRKNGSINNNNSEYDSDVSSKDMSRFEPPKPSVHKKNVTKSTLAGGRVICVGDIIWGKIVGFPWWPGRVVQIIVTRNSNGSLLSQEAQITWFAARSISYMPLEKLPAFLKDFKKYYDKKRKGVYKEAIAQATKAAEAMSSEVRELHTMFETPLLNNNT